jgi:transposase
MDAARWRLPGLDRRIESDRSSWLHKLPERRNPNVAAVALANKNARIVWALLGNDREFRSDYTRAVAAA